MPKLVTVPQSISVVPGTSQVTLECSAIGSPPPHITWSHNGRGLASSSRHFIFPDGSLTIKHIEGADHGTYRCEASNYNGKVSAEANVLIKGKYAVILLFDPFSYHCYRLCA